MTLVAEAPTLAHDRLYRRFVHEVSDAQVVNAAGFSAAGFSAAGASPVGGDEPVTEREIADLPAAVQRYLRFMGVIGRPRSRSLRSRFVGKFRLRPGARWMPAEAWQYNTHPEVARVFVMRLRFGGAVPMFGRDSYLHGHGRMVGKLLDRIPVAEGAGAEFDISELTTYLNDAVLLAPSMLLTPAVGWTQIGEDSFEVSLADAGRTVRGRVLLDADGAPRDFTTDDRFADLPDGLVRTQWRTPVGLWRMLDGRAVPGKMTAVWQLPGGPFPYASGRMTHLAHNVLPE